MLTLINYHQTILANSNNGENIPIYNITILFTLFAKQREALENKKESCHK